MTPSFGGPPTLAALTMLARTQGEDVQLHRPSDRETMWVAVRELAARGYGATAIIGRGECCANGLAASGMVYKRAPCIWCSPYLASPRVRA